MVSKEHCRISAYSYVYMMVWGGESSASNSNKKDSAEQRAKLTLIDKGCISSTATAPSKPIYRRVRPRMK
jgi:hypothetical protein